MPAHQPSPTEIHLTFPSGEMAVREALAALKLRLVPIGLGEDVLGSVELVLGEVLNNVVEHAYGAKGEGEIEISCARRRGGLWFRVSDLGRALPGMMLPEGVLAELDCARDDLPEGGFGWFLVRSLTVDLKYRREDGRNILEFVIPPGADV